MIVLRRTVRFAVNGPGVSDPGSGVGFSGSPAIAGVGRYYEVEVACRGEADPVTGYLINIKDVDRAVRSRLITVLARAAAETPGRDPALVMPALFGALAGGLGTPVRSIRWRLTPYHSLEMDADAPNAVILRQQLDFSAAHRLHVESLSDEENRAIFGRCDNPNGHGHNYRIEPAVSMPVSDDGAPAFTLGDLERLAKELLIDPFDHKHLNEDTREFSADGGVNPTVENIARVFFERLAPAVAATSKGRATLRSMTVWETDRTSATYPGS